MINTKGLMRVVFCVFFLLLVSPSAFGYGIDGTKDSADFTNQLGAWPGYANYQYEGEADDATHPGHPYTTTTYSVESFSNGTPGGQTITSDGDIMNMSIPYAASGVDGTWGTLNPLLGPDAENGYTFEFRARFNDLAILSGSNGQYWSMYIKNDFGSTGLRMKGGHWTGYNSVITWGGTDYTVADFNDWHTYRVACLGLNSGDGLIHSNLYQDTTLIGTMTHGSGSDPGNPVMWLGASWNGEIASCNVDLDYFRIDSTGAWAPLSVEGEYTLSVYAVGNGTIAIDPNKAIYLQDDVVELTATADPGWTFDHWGGDLSGSTNPDTVVMTDNTYIAAHFTSPTSPEGPVTVISPTSAIPSIVRGTGNDTGDAADELAKYLTLVSGRTVSVVSSPASTGTIIHVGYDPFAKATAPEIANLYGDGFVMKYVYSSGRDHLILAGKFDHTSLWAVEQFLKDYAGVRWLFPDATYGEVIPSIPTIAIDWTLNETHEPDYTSRSNLQMYYYYPTGRQLRLRAYGSSHGSHEVQFIFDDDDFDDHPDWFAWFNGQRNHWTYGNGWQICLANQETVDHAVEYCLAYFAANPGKDTASVGMNDGAGMCTDTLSNNLRNSVSPPYTDSEMSWQWVNRVAAGVAAYNGGQFADKWVEALAYSWTSTPPRFALESNVAITKTIVFDSEIGQAEDWADPPASCQSINLYAYNWGASFIGFRHYPTATRDFLRWGRDTLGAMAFMGECRGDWTFDGPKYYYTQAFQWDADADPNEVMTEFCDASYGSASAEMKAFWDRLEEVWYRRGPVPYGQTDMSWLWYQWVGWATQCYIQPNDEFREYTLSDVAFLDTRIANAVSIAAGGDAGVQYRMARMQDAWEYYRTMLVSYVYLNDPPSLAVNSEVTKQAVMDMAREISGLEDDRYYYLAQMQSYTTMNPRLSDSTWFKPGWMTVYTIFSNEQTLLDEACASISDYIKSTTGIVSAIQHWEAIGSGDDLYEAAQTQIYLLRTPSLTNLLTNGNFEFGSLNSWASNGSTGIASGGAHGGTYSARLMSGACYGGTTISQTVSVSPQNRYQLSVWGKYMSTPPADYVATEATIEFYNGGSLLENEFVNRATFQSHSPADGWTQLTMAATPPAGANLAKVTMKMKNSAEVRIDDVRFEKIKGNITLPTVCGGVGTIYHETDLYPDCYIDFIDVDEFASSWLDRPCTASGWCSGADINKSGEVDFADFAWFFAQWADCTDPTGSNCDP